MMHYMF